MLLQSEPVFEVNYILNNPFPFTIAASEKEKKEINGIIVQDGTLMPFYKFFKAVKETHPTADRSQLEREYNVAIASAQMAAHWSDWKKDGGEVILQLRAGDNPDLAPLNGITLPMSDKFWKEFLTPNHWNDNGITIQVSKRSNPLSDSKKAYETACKVVPQFFRYNCALKKHPKKQ